MHAIDLKLGEIIKFIQNTTSQKPQQNNNNYKFCFIERSRKSAILEWGKALWYIAAKYKSLKEESTTNLYSTMIDILNNNNNNNMNINNGLILSLSITAVGICQYFDCDIVIGFLYEEKKIFIGGKFQLLVYDIIELKNGIYYKYYIALNIIQNMMQGKLFEINIIDMDNNNYKTIQQCIIVD